MFLLNIFLSWWPCGKHSSIKCRNLCPILVATLLLYGGLNHIMFLLHDLFFFGDSGLNFSWWSYLLLLRASWYGGIAMLNDSSSEEMFESLLFIVSGMLRIMAGGWLLSRCTYRGVLFGLVNGLKVPVLKFSVMSR